MPIFRKSKPPQVPVKNPPSDETKGLDLWYAIREANPFKIGYRLDENHRGALYIFSTAYPQKHCFLSFRPYYDYVEVVDLESPINTDIVLGENSIQITFTPDIYFFTGAMIDRAKKKLTNYLTKVATGEIKA
jgi:hypothetical protein